MTTGIRYPKRQVDTKRGLGVAWNSTGLPQRDHALISGIGPRPATGGTPARALHDQTRLSGIARTRVYRMTLAGNLWTIWRNVPGFNQGFTATRSADGNTFDGRWEMSGDGQTRNLGFELSCHRER